MSGMAQELFDLTSEQREIRDVCREFATRADLPASKGRGATRSHTSERKWFPVCMEPFHFDPRP